MLLLRCVCVGEANRLMVVCGGGVWGYSCDLIGVAGIFVVRGLVVRIGWVLGFGLSVGFPA